MAASTSIRRIAAPAIGPRLGLGSYALRWTLRDEDPLSSCRLLISVTAELGLGLVQIADNVDLLELDARQRRELRAEADDAKVHIEVGTRSYRATDFRRMLRVAEAFDSQHIRVVGVDLRRLSALLVRVRADVSAWGGGVVVENYFPVRSSDLLATLSPFGDWVGTCADTANSIPAGEWPLDTLRNLLPDAHYVHIKDYKFVAGPNAIGWMLIGTPLGSGQQEVREIVRATAAAHHCPDLILEHWLPRMGSQRATTRAERAWLEQGLSVLRQIAPAS